MRKFPAPTHPESAEREYKRFLNSYAQAYVQFMREGLKEILPSLKDTAKEEQPRFDDNIESRIKRLFHYVQQKLERIFPDPILRAWALAMIGHVTKNSKKNMDRFVKSGLKQLGQKSESFEPFMRDRQLSPFYQNAVDENVGLIRSIPLEKLPTFKNQLVALITADAPSKQIQDAILKNFKLTKSKAELIAVDQVGKINGALEEYRQKQLGVWRYTWRTSGDRRVRHDHKILDGTVQLWSKPPIVDRRTGRRAHPKKDYRCRCWAEPKLDDILEKTK